MGCTKSKISNEHVTRPEPGCTVFLGGSCNPTTWRKEIVIPLLEKNNIDYYNPQVDEWSPELIVTETYQKDHAKYLFFVIDDETRAIASMIEAGYHIAQGRKVILVIKNVNESRFDERELKDLNRGRTYLHDIAEKHNVTVFDLIEPAIRYLIGLEVNHRLNKGK
jgi:hypothetical protein